MMKRMCGIILSRIQLASMKVIKNPTKNAHTRRMREDVLFYRDWLLPKYRLYCDELGWTMPQVRAFEIDDDELMADEMDWISNNIDPTEFVTRQYELEEEISFVPSSRHGVTSTSSLDSSRSKKMSRKLISIIRRSIFQDANVEAARLRAANLLRPQPFLESNIRRLNELKNAKNKADNVLPIRHSLLGDMKRPILVLLSCLTG